MSQTAVDYLAGCDEFEFGVAGRRVARVRLFFIIFQKSIMGRQLVPDVPVVVDCSKPYKLNVSTLLKSKAVVSGVD